MLRRSSLFWLSRNFLSDALPPENLPKRRQICRKIKWMPARCSLKTVPRAMAKMDAPKRFTDDSSEHKILRIQRGRRQPRIPKLFMRLNAARKQCPRFKINYRNQKSKRSPLTCAHLNRRSNFNSAARRGGHKSERPNLRRDKSLARFYRSGL